jgi:Fe-S-cluster containining protein
VTFDWAEADDVSPGGVPVGLTLEHNHRAQLRCMAGTRDGGRCEALTGVIGESSHCEIHQRRPSACRSFAASYEDGKHERRCDESRAKHGLLPLTLEDWLRRPD